ncbi:MAG: response regulator [Chloroflexi bacterium]|nr:response regulator [Chloroflexota bacterium]
MKRLANIGIENKISALVLFTLLVGIAVFSFIDVNEVTREITGQHREKSEVVADAVAKSIENVMLVQKGDSARGLVENMRSVPQVDRLRVFNRRGAETFASITATGSAPVDREKLSLVLAEGKPIEFYENDQGQPMYTVMKPLPNAKACQACHENHDAVQGVVEVSTSLDSVNRAVRENQLRMLGMSLLSLLVMAVLLRILLRMAVIRPLGSVMATIEDFTDGNLSHRVKVTSADEIGMLAANFNHMADVIEKSQSELQMANAELQRANRLKSEFLANMSHELRTPLNAIIGFSELLRNQAMGPLNEKQSRYVANVHSSGTHLLQLINDILDLAKIEAGKIELQPEAFLLSEALESAHITIKPLANKKNISVQVRIPEGQVIIHADPAKFKQIMYNLMSNAIKFTPEGGRVTVQATIKGALAEVSVSDTGIGIAPQDQERIFGEFQQVDGSYSRRYEGTGLGLALTRRLVNLHGGEIRVESELGRGSTFAFTVPLASALQFPEAESSAAVDRQPELSSIAKEGDGADARVTPLVLVVEDDPVTNELVSLWLHQEGYQAVQAFDGAEAVKKAKELHPFAIVLDLMLPTKDGWQVLRELKDDQQTYDIPVVIVSALEERERGFAFGAVDYLVKPVDRHRLVERLSKLSVPTKAKQRPTSVLVVDDHPESVELLREILETEGIDVIKAYGGREAIQQAIDQLPDLMILDLMMPEVNGFEVVAELKKHPIAQHIPIIVFTAKDVTEEDRRRLAGNVRFIMQKQRFSRDEILGEVMRLEVLYPEKAGLDDKLTGLLNHEGFQRQLLREVSRSRRHEIPLSVVLMDVEAVGAEGDGSARANFGNLLKDLATVLRTSLRFHDIVARYGSEQFVVLLPQISKPSAIVVAQKLTNAIARYNETAPESLKGIRADVFCGVAVFPEDANGPEELMTKARKAVARAKSRVGERIVVT